MKYFHFGETRKLQVIGHYPQSERAKDKGFDVEAYNSERKVEENTFPDFEPSYGLDLHPDSNATDILDKSTLPFGFVLSEKLKVILEEFHLPPHRFYPIHVFGSEKKYYWFHYISKIWEFVDFESTQIEVFHKFKFNTIEIKTFNSIDEMMEFKRNLPRQNSIRIRLISLTNKFPQYDLFEITGPQYFTLISQNLKQKLEDEDITGFGITAYDKIEVSSSFI